VIRSLALGAVIGLAVGAVLGILAMSLGRGISLATHYAPVIVSAVADHPALLVIWCAVVVGLLALAWRVNAR